VQISKNGKYNNFNTTPSMAHNYCPYELVFGKTNKLAKQFNSIENIEPIYNIYDYAKESKYRLEVAYKRARIMIEKNKENNKIVYDQKIKNIDISVGDQVLLRNETGHKLDYQYTGPYKVTEIGERNNIIITNNKNKKQTVYRDRLKKFKFKSKKKKDLKKNIIIPLSKIY